MTKMIAARRCKKCDGPVPWLSEAGADYCSSKCASILTNRKERLEARYAKEIGYDIFRDDPSLTEEDVIRTLREHEEAGA